MGTQHSQKLLCGVSGNGPGVPFTREMNDQYPIGGNLDVIDPVEIHDDLRLILGVLSKKEIIRHTAETPPRPEVFP